MILRGRKMNGGGGGQNLSMKLGFGRGEEDLVEADQIWRRERKER